MIDQTVQRMISAEILVDDAARQVPEFDLDRAIAEGMADFGHGTQVALELRVRGYLVNLLIDCPLSKGQTWEEEPPGSDFDIRVSAQVPETGQLLRWLLGAGANVEVIAPEELRRVVADQASNTLGWRWVASIQTPGKTYRAQADNIGKYTEGRYRPLGLAAEAQPIRVETLPQPKPIRPLAPPYPRTVPSSCCCTATISSGMNWYRPASKPGAGQNPGLVKTRGWLLC